MRIKLVYIVFNTCKSLIAILKLATDGPPSGCTLPSDALSVTAVYVVRVVAFAC